MPTFNLNSKKAKEVLKVEIGDKTYSVPLASSLKFKEVKKLLSLKKLDGEEAITTFGEFFAAYLGADVVDNLTMDDITALANAWSNATSEASGITSGES